MALSMEEQQILTQIEVHLSENDPRLAHRLSELGTPRRRRRIALITALAVAGACVLTAAVATVVIVMS
ncbi:MULTISPECIES: DUF3040 domain-containing protein [Thermomonosporaceae]|uniref:DUF3040 domain-containing protein n=1 Tax=Thermomonosporaceae TaxID=2012 RepID=UPI00255AD681|nr:MULTISPECIES: DUF3040 domain-containing protein [Thermomonosporaceae]MDL4776637.1 DUF3040 domain-containing protein [Actinomadura xylanilytica]